MRKILLLAALPLVALCLPLTKGQATTIGVPVPKPTATGQSITSTSTAPFKWIPLYLPYTSTTSGQVAVGGNYNTSTRLSVNPSYQSEDGLTINLPSGSTGKPFQVKDSTGTSLFAVNTDGSINAASTSLLKNIATSGIAFNGNAVNGFSCNGNGPMGFNNYFGGYIFGGGQYQSQGQGGGVVSSGQYLFQQLLPQIKLSGTAGFTVLAVNATEQTLGTGPRKLADLQVNGVTKAQIDDTGVATFPAVQTATTTQTAPYTLTATDTTILVNGAFAVTLPAASVALAGHSWTVKQIGAASSTLVGTIDGNTSGYTLAAQNNFCTFVCDGTAFYIVGKG